VTRPSRKARAARTERNAEAARYRRAAEAALEQVDVCIEYLRRTRKLQLASRLKKNRDQIKRSLAGRRSAS
jgi:hypothetical protein